MLPEERRHAQPLWLPSARPPKGRSLPVSTWFQAGATGFAPRSVVYAGKLHTAPFVVRELPAEQAVGHVAVALLSLAGRCPAFERGVVAETCRRIGSHGTTSCTMVRPSAISTPAIRDRCRKRGRTLVYYLPFASDPEVARHALLNQSSPVLGRRGDVRPDRRSP